MTVDPSSPRYLRQRTLDGFGGTAQRRLAGAHVLVIGAGGLGSAVLPALAAAGVGRITLVDDDDVELTNLHRQTVHGGEDVGRAKVASAASTIARLSPDTDVVMVRGRFDAKTADELLIGADVLVDGSDNAATRYLADDRAAAAGIPLVWGSALGWVGQAGVASERDGVRYRDLYPDQDAVDDLGCDIVGVLPTVCTVIGGIMATETLKVLTGLGAPLIGRAQVYDARSGSMREVAFRRSGTEAPRPRAAAPASDVEDGIVPAELDAALRDGDPVLLDVREPDETAESALPGAVLIPLGELEDRWSELDPQRPVVVYCRRGIRSRRAVELLRGAGLTARHLVGGLDALAAEPAGRDLGTAEPVVR